MIDVSSGQDALRIRYQSGLERVLLDDDKLAPFYADIARKEIGAIGKAFGSKFNFVMKVGDPETSNVSLANAVTKAEATTEGGQSRYKELSITPTKRFSAVSVSGSAWRRSMSDMQSFVRLNSEELDSGLRALHRSLSNTITGAGYGNRGIIAGSGRTSTTVTITERSDMYKFRVGMSITAADTPNTTARTGTGRITNVNRQTQTITLDGVDPSAVWSDGDYLFESGDFSTSTLSHWLGVDFWVPTTVPGAGADATGIDRTSSEALIGHRFDATDEEDIVDAVQAAAADFADAGMTCDAVYVNPIDHGRMSKILNLNKRGVLERGSGKVIANIGYSQFILSCALGDLPVISDRTFPVGAARFMTRDSWCVAYDGKGVVAPIDEDGLVYRVASSGGDAFTAKMVSEAQLICFRAGDNGVAYNLPT